MKTIEVCLNYRAAVGRLVADRNVIKRPELEVSNKKASDQVENKKLLLVGCCEKECRNTVKDTIYCLMEKSNYQLDFFNLSSCWCVPPCIELSGYDGVIFHYTIGENISLLASMVQNTVPALEDYTGVKVLFRQDENLWENAGFLAQTVRKYRFNFVLTICNEMLQEKIYQKSTLPNVRFMQYLTGYVSDKLKNLNDIPDRYRKIDVGYRARKNPSFLGKLTYEKYDISRRFLQYSKDLSLNVDVSCNPKDTKYGDAWFAFLGNCKVTLGTESGGSIIDNDGRAQKSYYAYLRENPGATDEELLKLMEPYESDVWYNAVSPRHFEAAACGTLQILYEGSYQGVFIPYRHYLPLKKDWSNIDEIMMIALDPEKRKKIVEQAYSEIVLNSKYSFDYFVKQFDSELTEIFQEKGM